MSEHIANYNETDAIQFIHENISEELQKRYNPDSIGYILDIVYEYYDIIEEDGKKDEKEPINLPEMLAFVNESLKESDMEVLTEEEFKEILSADNDYMDSIDPEGAEDVVNLDEVIDDIYKELPEDIQKKYGVEDVYLMLCLEADYVSDNDIVSEDELRSYIIDNAAKEDIKIEPDTLSKILAVEARLLGEE